MLSQRYNKIQFGYKKTKNNCENSPYILYIHKHIHVVL